MSELRRISDLLNQSQDITVLIHQQPDGDAIGSSAALYYALKDTKNIRIVCATALPKIFTDITGPLPVCHTLSHKTDVVIVLDCSELHRTGFRSQLKASRGVPIVVIDHHQPGDLCKLAHQYYGSDSAAATAYLIEQLLSTMRSNINGEAATALLLGLYTDTGGFKHANTSSNAFTLASRLIRYGANLSQIVTPMSHRLADNQRQLWGKVLSNIQMNRLGIVVASVTQEMLTESNGSPEDLSGLANLLALTHQAKAALVLVETNHGWRGTLRTRYKQVDLGRLARYLGGKGQKKAAGFTATKELLSDIID